MRRGEINGKRSHVRHARSANLLSAVNDPVTWAAMWGTKWQNQANKT